jgi:hypothetical protein
MLGCRRLDQTLVTVLFIAGCSHDHASPHPRPVAPAESQLSKPVAMRELDAEVVAPSGWCVQATGSDSEHTHATWSSPTGDTIYGVVWIHLPLPVGPNLVLWGFLQHLRQVDKVGNLVSKEDASDLPGVRCVADGSHYRLHVNLIVRGWQAWAIFAGTMQSRPVNLPELELAKRACDCTRVPLAE